MNPIPDCAGLTDLFFCESFDKHTIAVTNRAAKQICLTCPLKTECLAGALQRREKYGIWGGTTPDERAKLRRQ